MVAVKAARGCVLLRPQPYLVTAPASSYCLDTEAASRTDGGEGLSSRNSLSLATSFSVLLLLFSAGLQGSFASLYSELSVGTPPVSRVFGFIGPSPPAALEGC